MNKPVLVVLAAGMGTRYGGMKQIDPVGPNNQIIIDYSIYDAKRVGFETVIFVIKKETEEIFRKAIGDKIAGKMEVKYVFQDLNDLPEGFDLPENRVKPWGTAHAVLAAREVINSPFVVINADDYYGQSGFKYIYNHLSAVNDDEYYQYSMVGYLLKNTYTS